jgi:hypothetical protein
MALVGVIASISLVISPVMVLVALAGSASQTTFPPANPGSLQ